MKKTYLFLLFLIYAGHVLAQQKPAKVSLASILKLQDSLHLSLPIEKLYVQSDKPYYNTGDTIRFKTYLLNNDFLTATQRSGVLYIELDNEDGKSVKRIMVPVVSGLSWGDIALDEKDTPQGSYTLRAYTNWMRNFGEEYVFKKDIYISRASTASALIKADFNQVKEGDKEKVTASLRFTDLSKHLLAVQDMQLRVVNGTHNLTKSKVTTGVDGMLNVNFDLADKTTIKNLAIQVQQTGKDADTTMLTIPITLNRPENTDLQFMPEGGNLVSGITTKVGFKAIGEDGKGKDIGGKIYNTQQEEVAGFASLHKGMGSFTITPQPGETYTAKVILPGGQEKTYQLPQVKNSGTTLSILDPAITAAATATATNDSLYVIVSVTPDLQNSTFYLMGNLREAFYATTARFVHQTAKTFAIAKSLFPTGIVRFSLLNQFGQPLNERMAYIDHGDNLKITINPSKKTYAARDSIALNILVTDKKGKPVQGSFSLAVTDDEQVGTDSLGDNMANNLLLTSDLKGTIEDPGYYLKSKQPQRAAALDNMLLTQGWTGYDWKQLFDPKIQPLQYAAEPEYTITGRISGYFNKPVEGARLGLMSTKPFFMTDTVTGKNGLFAFKGIFPADTSVYVIQAKRKNGSANVSIDVDKFIPPVFTYPGNGISPWYLNSDTLLLHNIDINVTQRQADEKLQFGRHILKAVTIKDKKIIPGSHNLNGTEGADFTFDATDMEKAKGKTLFEFLQSKFKNFYNRPAGSTAYFLNGHRVNFVIDGLFISTLRLPVDLYMNALMAQDIKGVEIMYHVTYAEAYNPMFLMIEAKAKTEADIPVYLEITTYSGQGAYINKTPNLNVYRPIPFTIPKQFYSPKYRVKNIVANAVPDLRSTIHWDPNIITNKNGKATVSFYVSDRPNNYTVIMEGSDMNGNIGSVVQKLGKP